jgi:hypothetical protein
MTDTTERPQPPAKYPHVPPAKRSGSETRQRSFPVTFRTTATERAEIKAAADRAGLSPSSYIRAQALATPKMRATRKPPVDRAALAQLLGQVGKIGGNINQLARNENRGRANIWLDETLKQCLDELAQMKVALMQALGRGER